jgi:gas vesicle protein
MKKGSVAVGLLAGLAAGAVLGVLFAPDNGTNTRKKITNKSKDSLDTLKDKYNEAIDQLSSKLESVRKKGDHSIEEGKKLVENVQ